MLRLQLRSKVRSTDIDARAGSGVTRDDVDVLLQGDAAVYKPDGNPLVIVRRNVLSKAVVKLAYPHLHYLRKYLTDNRGGYTGMKRVGEIQRTDGRLSRQNRTLDDAGNIAYVASAIIGYYDPQGGRFPYCRQTAFTANEVERWEAVLPLVREVASVYEKEAPARYAKQMEVADKTHPDFIIKGTPFTTLTVNNNVIGNIHKDKGDFKDGLGVITAMRRGQYEGAWLTFPEYRVGVELNDRDVLLFNPHDWHGVTPFEREEKHERISVVYYFRSRMVECGSAAEELAKARARGKL